MFTHTLFLFFLYLFIYLFSPIITINFIALPFFAGAKMLRIVIDETSYGSESVLGPTMASLQGPAVLVYNDAKFTESDYKALARIGQGSKIDRLATTGRFGLGFNSVYHITDTPSFVSGGHLVFFDPHTSYVPGATLVQPGLRIKFVDSQLDVTFPDQFAPFRFFDCDFKSSYDGTLFRFPLRSHALAKTSEISRRAYSIEDVNSLLGNLQQQLAQHLLFLRSLRYHLYPIPLH
jgi:sacsin